MTQTSMPFGWEMSLCLKKDFTVKDIKKKRKNIKKKEKHRNIIHKWGEVHVEKSPLPSQRQDN